MSRAEIQSLIYNYGFKQGLHEWECKRPRHDAHIALVLAILLDVMRDKLTAQGLILDNGCVVIEWVSVYELGLRAGRKGMI